MPINCSNDANESPNTQSHDNLKTHGRNEPKLTYPRVIALTKNLPTHSKFFKRESVNRKDENNQALRPLSLGKK